jgi:hypothetical protein
MYSMTERKHSLTPITIVLSVALALAGFFAFLMTPAGRPIWLSAYPVLIWFNVDHAFPAETDIALGTVSGPDVLVPGSNARRLEVAKVCLLCRIFVDVDYSWHVTDTGGPTVHVKVRTWHPTDSSELVRHIREAYDKHGADPTAWLATEFVTYYSRSLDDDQLPESIYFPPSSDGIIPDPILDGTARLVVAAGTNAVPHLLDKVANPQAWDAIAAHILLHLILHPEDSSPAGTWHGLQLDSSAPLHGVGTPTFSLQDYWKSPSR